LNPHAAAPPCNNAIVQQRCIAFVSVLALAVSATHARAQQPPPYGQPAPQQAPWFRLTLDDGRVIDVQIVGNDAANFHVQQNGAVYALPRAKIVSSVALSAPAPAYTPPPAPAYAPPPVYAPPPPPPAVPLDEKKDWAERNPRAAGWAYFGSAYVLTACIALARQDNDSTAWTGLIPVVGPMAWTVSDDEDDLFEDGWDWLALGDSLIQAGGLIMVMSSSKKSGGVALTPVSRRSFHGLALGGTF
jgi:hypothetical protein